jgi:hypothetical protein
MLPDLMTVKELGEFIRLERKYTYEFAKKLPPGVRINIGGGIRIDKVKLLEWMAAGGSPPRKKIKNPATRAQNAMPTPEDLEDLASFY